MLFTKDVLEMFDENVWATDLLVSRETCHKGFKECHAMDDAPEFLLMIKSAALLAILSRRILYR